MSSDNKKSDKKSDEPLVEEESAKGAVKEKRPIDPSLSYVRRNIEKQLEHAEKLRLFKLKAQRVELARAGNVAYYNKRLGDAVRAFRSYIHILEQIHGVSAGGLIPSCFDPKEDVSELLMLSGVYWDLVKLFDRTRSPRLYKEFQHYMEKFILFSKGQPHQALCTEALRKYILAARPIHMKEFKNAFKVLGGSDCFIVTSLLDEISEPTLPKLRMFRDQVLAHSFMGRAAVRWYYHYGPGLAERVDHFPQGTRRILARVFDQLARVIAFLFQI